jgi:methylmalonyl-CoA carboxyltransferase large subunit
MFITGPGVIKQVTGEVVTAEELGGPATQMNKSGVSHFVAEGDAEAIAICQRLLSFLPSNNLEEPPLEPFNQADSPDELLNSLVPENSKLAYDVRVVIDRLVDGGDFLEVQAGFAAPTRTWRARTERPTTSLSRPRRAAICSERWKL